MCLPCMTPLNEVSVRTFLLSIFKSRFLPVETCFMNCTIDSKNIESIRYT